MHPPDAVPRPPEPGRDRAGPLQNRVTPFGTLIATPARGTLMGNRGRLHDERRRVVRRVAPGYRAWVTCLLAFRGRWRPIMEPGRYTELFFLDEATALAAGHRPCGECRRLDHRRFRTAWLAGNPGRGPGPGAPVAALDRVLHEDRLAADGRQRTFRAALEALPDGVFVTLAEASAVPLLLWRGALRAWSPAGYGPAIPRPGGLATVLTPRSTVAAIRAGYVPGVHPSAG
jgi:PAS domain-containing protein